MFLLYGNLLNDYPLFFTLLMHLHHLLQKPDIAFRLRSIGLCLASPTNIRSWAFKLGPDNKPIIGKIKNAKTVNYKTLLPEEGGLFCPTVFGQTKDDQRHKLGYVKLGAPITHLWYLKATPSYISLLLNKKRKLIQSIVYAQAFVSFSKQTFDLKETKLTFNNLSSLVNLKMIQTPFNHLTPYNRFIANSELNSFPYLSAQNKWFLDAKDHPLTLTSKRFNNLVTKHTRPTDNNILPLFFWNKRVVNNRTKTNKPTKVTKVNKTNKIIKTNKIVKKEVYCNNIYTSHFSFYSITKTINEAQLKLKQDVYFRFARNKNQQIKQVENLSPLLHHFYQTNNCTSFYQTVEPNTYFVPHEKLNSTLQAYYGVYKSQASMQYQNYFWLIYAHKNFIKLLFFLNLTHQIKLYHTLQNFIQFSIKAGHLNQHLIENSTIIIDLLNTANNLKRLHNLTNNQFDHFNNEIFKQAFQEIFNKKINKKLNKAIIDKLNDLNNSKNKKWLESKWATTYLNQTSKNLQISAKLKRDVGFKFKKSELNCLVLKYWLKNKHIKIRQWKLLKEAYELLYQVEVLLFQLPSLNLMKRALNLHASLKSQSSKSQKQNDHTKIKKIFNFKKRNEKLKTVSNALTYNLNKKLLYLYPFTDKMTYLNSIRIDKMEAVELKEHHLGFYVPLVNSYPYVPMWMLYQVNGNQWLTLKKDFFQYLKTYFINTNLNQLKWASSSKSLTIWLKTLEYKLVNENQICKQAQTNVKLNNNFNSKQFNLFSFNKKLNITMNSLKSKNVSLLQFQYELQKGKFDQMFYFSNQYWFSTMALTTRINPLQNGAKPFKLETVLTYKKINEFCLRKQLQLFKVPWHPILNQMVANGLPWDEKDQHNYERVFKENALQLTRSKLNKTRKFQMKYYKAFNKLKFIKFMKALVLGMYPVKYHKAFNKLKFIKFMKALVFGMYPAVFPPRKPIKDPNKDPRVKRRILTLAGWFKVALRADNLAFFYAWQNGHEQSVTHHKTIRLKQCLIKNVHSFELDYIPLTYRYSHIQKTYMPLIYRSRYSQKVYERFKRCSLKNPLGHKNYRQFVKEKFALSVKKSICISQLKHYSKSLLFEKTVLAYHLRKKAKTFEFALNDDYNFLEKQRFIYFVLMHLQTNRTPFFEKIKTNSTLTITSWYSKLSQYQLYFLCPFERFNYFNNKQKFKGYLYPLFNTNCIFIQKPQNNYNFLKVRLPFTKPLNESFTELSSLNASVSTSNLNYNYNKNVPVQNKIKINNSKKQIFSLNNRSFLLNKQNYIRLAQLQKMYWKKELEIFKRVNALKSRLNSLLSSINHKVNLFLLACKPSLALNINEILGFHLKPPSLSIPITSICGDYAQRFDERRKKTRDYKDRVRFYGQKAVLKKLHIDFQQKSSEIVNRCANYFSLKTKLIKAKSVRLLLAYRLVTRFSSAAASLKQLLWNLNLKTKTLDSNKSICVIELDYLLYNRLMMRKRILPISPVKHFIGKTLERFLNHTRAPKNTYYVVEQGFAWVFNTHYDILNYYMSRKPRPDDFIIPAYVEQCITFERPRTGSWAIRLLLNKFKPAPERTAQLHTKLIKFENKSSLFHHYYNSSVARLWFLNKEVMCYKTFCRKIVFLPFPRNPVDWFDFQCDQELFYNPTHFRFRQRRALIFYKRRINRINVKRNVINRRIKFLRPWLKVGSNPTFMTLTLVPVLPPALRPILPLSGGQFAMADLNKLYQQVIYRNIRLQRFHARVWSKSREEGYMGFGKILRFNYRLMQEAVDALMDNGKSDSKVILNNQNQPLKSLSEGLRGKKGRFRQNLLGKRVDYSGRSVIVVGPQLQVHQCGLPKEMALELFQPFLVQQLIKKEYAISFTRAKKLIKLKAPIIWTVLKELMLSRPVLLNRAPTLHRLGIQAFQPLLISGRAILLHPLVCSAFNADFDGDQMAVHVPLSYDACSEAWKLMWSRNNLFSLATGEPNLTPTQDMVLGCYYLSAFDNIKNQFTFTEPNLNIWFSHLNEVIQAYDHNYIDLHQIIWLKWSNQVEFDLAYQPCLEFQLDNKGHKRAYYTSYCHYYDHFYWIRTTVGRILLNQLIFDLIN